MSQTSRNTPISSEGAAPANSGDGHTPGLDFIRTIVAEDLATGAHTRVVTRFPPEPNGFLHIGHATSICLNFGIAEEFGGRCHLRLDDTNPETEDERYVQAIIDDVHWLGFDWGEHLYYASDYFPQMFDFAVALIREGKAYVESLSEEEIREYRGTVTEPGRPSPYRDRSIEENLDLFQRMRAGEFPDGAHVLRAKLDLSATNMLLRDPVLYRIRHAHHYRTGDEWCIYPLYDYAHPIEDALEDVTHSICTLEFENNRAVYDWVVENVPVESRPRQYEFARRNLDYTVMSKRKLLELVRTGAVGGWDDPRMPTVAGLRRRGVTPAAVRNFADIAGVGKTENRTDIGKLEFAIRDDLNRTAPRVLCVIDPLRVVITNYPEGEVEELEAPYFPRDVGGEGTRRVPFSRTLYIERDDFREDPVPGYHRLAPGREVRLRYGYVVRCDDVVRDAAGEIVEVRCSYDPATRGGQTPDGRTIRGTIHWVSAEHSLPCEVRLYDRLFSVPDPEQRGDDFKAFLNPDSLVTLTGARIEPSVADDRADTRYQFERLGFFWRDPIDSGPERPIFNRIVTLRDTWAKRVAEAGHVPAPSGAAAEPAPKRAAAEATPARAAVEIPRSAELQASRAHFIELGIAAQEAEVLTRESSTADLFLAAITRGAPARLVANWIVHELPRELAGREISKLPFTGAELATLLQLHESGELSSSAAREVLAELVAQGGDPAEIMERKGLRQLSDPVELRTLARDIVRRYPEKANEYRAGRAGLLGFFIGQAMRGSGGRANPELLTELIREELASPPEE